MDEREEQRRPAYWYMGVALIFLTSALALLILAAVADYTTSTTSRLMLDSNPVAQALVTLACLSIGGAMIFLMMSIIGIIRGD